MGQHCVDCLKGAGTQQARQPQFGDRGIRPMAPNVTVARGPVATYSLIAINVIIFALVVIQRGGLTGVAITPIMLHGSLITGLGLEHEYWRLLTSGFLHHSVMHLAVNMISLYIIGRDLERALGIGRYLAIYLTGLLGGSALVMAFETGVTQTVGASGAIYGLLGAILVVVLKSKVSPIPVIVILVLNFGLSISIPGISLLGHLGGFLFGAAAAIGVILLPGWVLPPEKRTADRVSRIGWISIAVLVLLALGLGIGFTAADSLTPVG